MLWRFGEEMLLRADKLLKLLWEPKQWRSLARTALSSLFHLNFEVF